VSVTCRGAGESGLGSDLVLREFEGNARDNGGGSSTFGYEAVRRRSVADKRQAIPPRFLYNRDGSFITFYRN